MQDFNEFKGEFTTVIENSFDGAFDHYRDSVLKSAKQAGVTAPVVFVLELQRKKVKDSDLVSIDVQGKTYIPDVNPVREYIKKLGLQYIKDIDENNGNIPASIIVCSEVWVGEKKHKKGETPKFDKLQDKSGNPLNGSVEKFMVSGMTATDKKQFALYDIIRDKDGNITDFVLDEHGSGALHKGEAVILKTFYTTMAEYLKDKFAEKTKGLEGWSF